MVAAALGVGVGVAVAGPLALAAAGFTPLGVAAGSAAAGWQAGIGNVVAGTWFAAAQSAGAAGVAGSTSAAAGAAGGAACGAAGCGYMTSGALSLSGKINCTFHYALMTMIK